MRILLSAFALMLAAAPTYAADVVYDPEGSLEQASLTRENPSVNSMENIEPTAGMSARRPVAETTDQNYDPEGSLASSNQ